MAGHSKWSTIKRQKGANDAKRGVIFSKISNLIAIAARNGTDPSMNPALAVAIEKAKSANMPNSNIERAIARVADKSAAALIEEVYEGYGPGGVGIIIEVATDNKNRTLPEVKTALSKNGGRIADPGSVMFQFERQGVIVVEGSGEDILLSVLDAGAQDATEEGDEITVYTDQKDLMKVRQSLIDNGLKVKDAELQYVPTNMVPVSDKEMSDRVLKIMEAVDDLDDVVSVHTNADFLVD